MPLGGQRARVAASTVEAPLDFPSPPPLTLYVHLPWCVRKCPYCDFNSYEARGALPDRDYVRALLEDLDAECGELAERTIESVFIGGGTPSLFSGEAVEALIAGIRARVPLAATAEVTLEANPGAVEADRYAAFLAAGVNRLSLGVQSFADAALRSLGRIHSGAEAERAYRLARSAGFDNINLDLMYGLPHTGAEDALVDLERALDLGPEHLSWYQLTLEPGTAFHRMPPPLPGEAVVAEIEAHGRALLERQGYRRYEVSAYARAGRQCLHNRNYWRFGDYVGIGAGAQGKSTRPSQRVVLRSAKTRNPLSYMHSAGDPRATRIEPIASPRQLALEFMMNALRLVEGVELGCFEARAGQPRARISGALEEAIRRGWLEDRPDVLRATPAGFALLNRVLELFC